MPIYEFGYRGYQGPLSSQRLRWLVVARQGVQLALRSKLLRRMLFLSWTPMLYFSVIFFMIGSVTEIKPKPVDLPGFNQSDFWEKLSAAQSLLPGGLPHWVQDNAIQPSPEQPIAATHDDSPAHGDHTATEPDATQAVEPPLSEREQRIRKLIERQQAAQKTIHLLMRAIPGKDMWLFRRVDDILGSSVALRLVYDATSVRSAAWTACFYFYVVRVQTLVMIFVVMMVAPPLISNDLRGHSFLIYFSSAMTRRDYLVGKLAVVMFIISSVTILPGLTLYAISIAFAPSLGALLDTYHVVLRMSLVILVIGVPVSLGALYLSARTTHPRFAAFSWITVWVMGAIFETAISSTVSSDSWLREWSFLLSPYHLMTVLTEWIFGVRGELEAVGAGHTLLDRLPPAGYAPAGLALVLVLSVLAVIGIRRRISAPVSI